MKPPVSSACQVDVHQWQEQVDRLQGASLPGQAVKAQWFEKVRCHVADGQVPEDLGAGAEAVGGEPASCIESQR